MSNVESLASLRIEYETQGLSESQMHDDPIAQFGDWMQAAIDAGLDQPNTMVLATADPHGRASARAVLLKDFDGRGFVFYTNLASRKGREMAANRWASLCFVWLELHRQVRIEGPVEWVSDEESDRYFASRPRDAQVASAASPQSQIVPDRATLEAWFEEQAAAPGEIARPDHWGGVRVLPEALEFWQGRPHRFHDRIVYRRSSDGWDRVRLAP